MIYFTIDNLHFPTERKLNAYLKAHPDQSAQVQKHELPNDVLKDLYKQSKKKIKPKCPTCGK